MSTILDDVAGIRRLDAGHMLPAIASLPDQLTDAWRLTRELQLPDRYRATTAVAALGMGGSAIGGDLVRGIFGDRLTRPLMSVRDYELPRFVNGDTLVIASSYSGGTEETVSALATALERRAPVVVITTGGPIGDVARRAGLPLLTFPGGGQPRTAVGYSTILVAGLLERAGALEIDEPEVTAAAAAAREVIQACDPSVPTEHNAAKQLAWNLLDRLPVIEASGFLAPVARRWKTQLNENAKTAAIFEELPEATHNTVVGYGRPDVLNDHAYVVFLATPLEHPRNALRASLSTELLKQEGISHQVLPIGGEGRLAQAMAAIALGDLVSTYLAVLYGLDPTPVDAIGLIKGRLVAPPEDETES